MDLTEDIGLLAPKEVKQILRCSLSQVYSMAEKRMIPSVRWKDPGAKKSSLRFKKTDILKFIQDHYVSRATHHGTRQF